MTTAERQKLVTLTWSMRSSGRARWHSKGVHKNDPARWRVQLRMQDSGFVEMRATHYENVNASTEERGHYTVVAILYPGGEWGKPKQSYNRTETQWFWLMRLIRLLNARGVILPSICEE